MDTVQNEGQKASLELANEGWKELMKKLMK